MAPGIDVGGIELGAKLVVTAALLMCAVAAVYSVRTAETPGSAADWLAAWATMGGLIAASAAAMFSHGTLGREADRDEWRDEQEAQQQARLIAAWVTPPDDKKANSGS